MELADLGLSQEELRDLVVKKIADDITLSYSYDEDGDAVECQTAIVQKLRDEATIDNYLDGTVQSPNKPTSATIRR